MNTQRTKYYAVVSDDKSGPAFGVGKSPEEAKSDARIWHEDLSETITVEISRHAYYLVNSGNLDAWTL